jgi:hypothetical protein
VLGFGGEEEVGVFGKFLRGHCDRSMPVSSCGLSLLEFVCLLTPGRLDASHAQHALEECLSVPRIP